MVEIDVEKHVKFLLATANNRGFEWIMSEYLRMSGIYWSLTALCLLDSEHLLPKEELLTFVKSCLHKSGGFSAAPGHYPSIIYTLSAIQILKIFDVLDNFEEKETVVKFIKSLQNDDGSFKGYPEENSLESDTRYGFCAIASLKLLDRLDAIDTEKAVEYVLTCQNFDGAFGVREGSESHAGQVFCCVGTLKILDSIDKIDSELLGWWLAERQLPCGGLNGRPMKKEDVCYSWWALSSLVMINKSELIDSKMLKDFILSAQDTETGGFSDRPGDVADPFHTLFGLAGLSMLHHNNGLELTYKSDKNIILKQIDPIMCMPI